jgi:mannose-6-phosphate isomerase-like protein (cupin superfamily)
MKPAIIRAGNVPVRDLGRLKSQELLDEKELSITLVERITDGKLGIQEESDMVFYVLEGTGKCILADEEHELQKGDLMIIPKGTKYKTFNGLKLLTISTPRFNREKNAYLE